MGPRDIRVASTAQEAESLSQTILSKTNVYNVLGLDCEWETVGTRRPIALLQLCTKDGVCGLFRLRKCGITHSLQRILENNNILKVGVGVTNSDAKYLREDYKLDIKGMMDVRYLTMKVTGSRNGSLTELGKYFIDGYQPSTEMARSDWERAELTSSQIRYAAEDAWLGIEIFQRAFERAFNIYNPNKDCILHNCQPYINKTF